MEDGAERLDLLIQDVLQYSRMSRSPVTIEPVDLEKCLHRACKPLDAEIASSKAKIEIQPPLPAVLGHEPTLQQVLQNLLSNALKFVDPSVQPRVRIWSSDNQHAVRLWIEDNGIGIAPAYHQRIFGIFERLHSTEAYPGTGIGLALVAKGMTRMGGSVGLESTPREGSRFWIELPKAKVKPASKTRPRKK
jgi:signal transduction histidine kinase